ncbi:N-acetylglucosaminyl deacetylase, LmbE family [Seinonella peptonophila]|uniref:N-acetylglucosaminyl deacetylase, LmbE family n=2 Tax=Seinonella peptonophila TaxID=112248 RepID=A0A1M4X9X9_9BACL|nr:N-acetylglucosaminyl deacetylase, LmbE family [Seinonella peptonophila]
MLFLLFSKYRFLLFGKKKFLPSGKTLFVFAHPDDEMLAVAAILWIIANGDEVIVFTASKGEGGLTNDLCLPHELGTVREGELMKAMSILGVSRVYLRDYGDGNLPDRRREITDDLLNVIRTEAPDQVVTLPPSGVTCHPDHIEIQEATHDVVKSQSNRIPLFYRVIPKESAGIVDVEHDSLPITHLVPAFPFKEQTWAAMNAHRTQKEAMSTIFPALAENNKNLLWDEEYYSLIP